jgi:ABC-type cobalamin/Fe3+-siderophores transport system ATPase subunit
MRLAAITVANIAGLERVEISGLSDVVVFAGPNGVGKTRLIHALIQFFRNPRPGGAMSESLSSLPRILSAALGSRTLLIQPVARTLTSFGPFCSVLSAETDTDPPSQFRKRSIDKAGKTIHLLLGFREPVRESQRRKLAEQAVQLRAEGKTSMPLDFPDPLEHFKDAFSKLLAPKRLVDVDVKTQQIIYELDGETRPIETLSSGEREVVNIVFDFLLRNPSDCIVFFDEPELHLHPELSYKLLQTLSSIGKNNQFVFFTHSPEIITASIENSVVFVTPRKADKSNQAVVVSRDDATHHALNLLGQSIGIISLGKKLLLIEGNESSLDKQIYGGILRNEFPELVLVPVGGKGTIHSFDEVRKSILDRTIWGVEFFMLCDRDAVHEIRVKSVNAHTSERLKVPPRYHLENYFLDESHPG